VNYKEPKDDFREWGQAHEKMGKGITLTAEEIKKSKELLNGREL